MSAYLRDFAFLLLMVAVGFVAASLLIVGLR